MLVLLGKTRDRSIALVDAGKREQAVFEIGNDNTGVAVPRLRALLDQMRNEERRLLDTRDAALRQATNTFLTLLAVTAALLLLVAVTSLITVLSYTRSLARVAEHRDQLHAQPGAFGEGAAQAQRHAGGSGGRTHRRSEPCE